MREPRETQRSGDSISPDIYDSRYFRTSCEGFEEFRKSGGRKLGARFRKALSMARIRPGERVLDIGCGRGELVLHAALLGAHATGVDYSEEAVSIANETLAGWPAEVRELSQVRQMNARSLDFDDESFDVAFMSDIVEHLFARELAEALRETRRVLRPGGRLIVHTCPNRLVYEIAHPLYIRHVNRAIQRLAEIARYRSDIIGPNLAVGREYPRSEDERRLHINEQTASGLARLLKACGFVMRKTDHWEPRPSGRPNVELMLLDSVRYLRPASYFWPLNRLFTNHIWIVAER